MASIDKALEEELLEVGNKLLDPPSSVDNLVHLLRQVRRCLSRVEQAPKDSMRNALSPLLKALIADKLIKHSNDDVKVALASCFNQITRITAPDAPYHEPQMKDVLRLIVSSFENLHDKSSRWYKERILILQIFANVRLCLEMLDLECDALILEMFQNFFKTIREYHPEKVFSSMKTIMVLVLEESEDISLDLLSPILDSLNKENEVVLPIARKLGESVIESCATRVKPYLRQAVNKLGISLDDYSDVLASVCTVLLDASEPVRSSKKRTSSSKGSGSSKKTQTSSGSEIKGASKSSSRSDSPKIKKRKLRKVGLTAAKEVSAQQLPIISEETGDVPLIKRMRTSKTTASKVPPSSSTGAASAVSAAVSTEAPQAEGNSETLPNVIIAEISQSQPSTPPAQTISTQSPPSSQRITNDKPELLRDVIYTLSVLPSDKPQPPLKFIIKEPAPIKVTPSTSETSPQPYKFIHSLVLNPLVSKPNLELLRDVIYNDVRRVYQMRDAFVMPQELIQEADALKEKFCAAIDELKELSLKELRESLTELTDRMVRAIEHADVKMLTNYHHWPQNEIQEHDEEFMEEEIVHTSPEKAVSESCKEKEVTDRAQEFPKESMPSEPVTGAEVLKLQEDLASQKVKQETLEARITSLAENQNEMKEDQKELKAEVSSISVKQETMEEKMDSMISKLDAILLLLQQQRPPNP